MAFTPTEEAQLRQLLTKNPELLSLADNEATILAELGAQDVTLSDLAVATTITDSDVMLIRQGTDDKSIAGSVLKTFLTPLATTERAGIVERATDAEVLVGTDGERYVTPRHLAAKVNLTDFATQIGASSGVYNLPNGFIIQWGGFMSHATPGSAVPVVYPMTFPRGSLTLLLSPVGSPSVVSAWAQFSTASGFDGRATVGNTFISWFAFGR